MARFIGSSLTSNNQGEDTLVQKLIEYAEDSCIVYRNRVVYGAQFDVIMLMPGLGIMLFEVKDWHRDTIIDIPNGDHALVWTYDENTGKRIPEESNPYNQARGYQYKLESRIKEKTGKKPLVCPMVCFPSLTKAEYEDAKLNLICEEEYSFFTEDLITKESFTRKLVMAYQIYELRQKHRAPFDPNMMFRTRLLFESFVPEEEKTPPGMEPVPTPEPPEKKIYSITAFLSLENDNEDIIEKLNRLYSRGTKIIVFCEDPSDLKTLANKIHHTLKEKNLKADKDKLIMDFSDDQTTEERVSNQAFSVFYCQGYLIPKFQEGQGSFLIENGQEENDIQGKLLKFADNTTKFNYSQYRVEHCDINRNIIVRAGAGTGKTYTMISRIAFICAMDYGTMREIASRIVMITFTDEASFQMKEKIKKHFHNYYLLTGDTETLDFIQQIEGMQISTIHSYAKKIITQLGFEFGYGSELSVSASESYLKQRISENVEMYIRDLQLKQGSSGVEKLGLPIYQINQFVNNLIGRMHNQSVDIEHLEEDSFGIPDSTNGNLALHELFQSVIPVIQQEVDAYYREQNKIPLSVSMSLLEKCINNDENKNRLLRAQTGKPQYMFVDEFQDTDDVQIKALIQLAVLLEYKLFVVGDVKQCIYRFRGAQENAFEQLQQVQAQVFETISPGKLKGSSWEKFSLSKNYRTDRYLLDLFHESFARMGRQVKDGQQLLIYDDVGDEESGRLKGTQEFHEGDQKNDYYRKLIIQNDEERMTALFGEIQRVKTIIEARNTTGTPFREKENEIAILVRENWQAESIRQEGKKRGIEILTNTGGDLYTSEAALDMLILIQALLHYDEVDYLYELVTSNFIGGGVGKAELQISRKSMSSWLSKGQEKTPLELVEEQINKVLRDAGNDPDWESWKKVIPKLRIMPVLQILRRLYQIFKPWEKAAGGAEQIAYRLNVDLLFEELIRTANMDSVTINSLAGILRANIISKKNVDSREIEQKGDKGIIIRCVTIHKAKGLEYGAVILPFCSFSISRLKRSDMNVSVSHESHPKIGYQIKADREDKKITIQNNYFDEQQETNERMREEARILYVAMTRAIHSFSWIYRESKGTSWQSLIWEG